MKLLKKGVEDMKKYGITDGIGGICFVLGAAGMAESVTGQGSFTVSTAVMIIGFVLCLWGYLK